MRGEPPPAWGFGNNTVREDSADIAFVVANSLILLMTSAVGIAANLFVILAVCHQKSLQTAVNALVVNLAVVDTLRCVIDCPILFTIGVIMYRGGHVDELICDTQVASFSFSCCVQLLTLTCISAERDSPVYVKCKGYEETLSSYDTFGLYLLFPLWAVCFTIIILFYARIFAIINLDVDILSVSVACITSLSDPIIYAAVNPQFQTEFYRIKKQFVSLFNKT
ncbi:Melanopsin-like [Liparis tanakae]|uniref:Melanopsin-like n=1 Tax=Liparis tanakae TaxID=230148 RepID=A0A4Z2IXV2_9TELE|nr:Melanopsin-like [Liparis tanakae]